MAPLEEILGILESMDTAQITAMLAMVATLLILLIILAVRRRQNGAEIRIDNKDRSFAESAATSRSGRSAQQRVSLSDAEALSKPVSIGGGQPAAANPPSEVQLKAGRAVPKPCPVPQDSVLRRHYLANEEAKREALRNPYPTDSVLRRHYDALHKLAVEPATVAEISETGVSEARQRQASIIEKAVGKEPDAESEEAPTILAKISVPQDSVLRRHFITQLRAEIEADLSPKPSDSVLRRHYDNMVGSELEKRLTG